VAEDSREGDEGLGLKFWTEAKAVAVDRAAW